MTRKNNNTRNNENATARKDFRLEPKAKSETDKAREAAAREQEREARKAQRIQERADEKKFDELTMTVNDALRNVAAHATEELREGFTVADYMASLKLTKLTIKALRSALPKEFTREDGIYMPCTNAAVYDGGSPEDESNGKAVYYCVSKGKGENAHKVWKKAQTYGFSRIDVWSPRIVRLLLKAGMTYAERIEGYEKRNEEVKNCKQFYIMGERKENAVNGKDVHRKSVVEDYIAIDKDNVKFAD